MANIMMTDACNLRCKYCFANEFVNKDSKEISEENFDRAVSFILGDGTQTSLGLIGGEPTIHSKFDYFLRKLILNEKLRRVTIYTNGILIDKYFDIISHPKIYLLINCNKKEDMGEDNYKRLQDNLNVLLDRRMMEEQVTLGLNLFDPDDNYDFFVETLKKYHCKKARISITVPNTDSTRNLDAHGYFSSMKKSVLSLLHLLLSNDIIPHFDCNKIPACLLKKEELNQFKKYLCSDFIKRNIGRSNITDPIVRCSPVIDIRQDLTAVRCFGLSEYTKENIRDFNSISDLRNYYARTVDSYAYNTVYSGKCINCKRRSVAECMGGCLAFKINDIISLREYAKTVQKTHSIN